MLPTYWPSLFGKVAAYTADWTVTRAHQLLGHVINKYVVLVKIWGIQACQIRAELKSLLNGAIFWPRCENIIIITCSDYIAVERKGLRSSTCERSISATHSISGSIFSAGRLSSEHCFEESKVQHAARTLKLEQSSWLHNAFVDFKHAYGGKTVRVHPNTSVKQGCPFKQSRKGCKVLSQGQVACTSDTNVYPFLTLTRNAGSLVPPAKNTPCHDDSRLRSRMAHQKEA
eukprot:87313-Pelagomonas_calceolata.AAC.2